MKEKSLFIVFTFLLAYSIGWGQRNLTDSLRAVINLQKGDTAEVNTLAYLANEQIQIDSVIKYAQQGLVLAKKLNYRKGEADCLFVLGFWYEDVGPSFQNLFGALNIYESLHDNQGIASACLILQANYWTAENYEKALNYAFLGEKIAEANNVIASRFNFPGHRLAPLFLAEIGQIYVLRNQLDSALIYTQKAIDYNELFNGAQWNFPVYLLATIQTMQGNYKAALENYRSAIPLASQNGIFRDTLQILSGMSTLFKKTAQLDSAIYYAQKAAQSVNSNLEIKSQLEAVDNLAQVYKMIGDKDSVLKYIELSHALRDSMLSTKNDRELQNVSFNEQLKQEKLASEQAKYKNRIQLYATIAGLLIVLLIAGILWRNNIHRQKAYALLKKQKAETDHQKAKAENALEELKSTQAQLIQSEKMASLGELTAGIAHEIQNPLNFVNNFSEVNKELLAEMKNEMDNGNIEDAKAIANDVIDNQGKINHHGKRADAIVKGMLQHSKASAGQKEPTDINALADEYLRLSYHGMRAKVKDINATLQTDFDPGLSSVAGKINVVPQDIGRVLLNLYNNAFYAVMQKQNDLTGSSNLSGQQPYVPTVAVVTKKADGEILISVKDNGNGIPQNIVDKIFQPFFTTKPTGEGTGLGLSLSYDIIKAHGGEIKVETKAGEGTEFIISLPLEA